MNISSLKIESAQEGVVSINGDQVITMEEAVKKVFRHPPKRIIITAFKGSNPGFEFWVDKLKKGERLPRGKYFRACEYFRR
ncbi:hypothetical protein H3J60_004553 [Salmonella enterica]|nr:hypothetical protein [Salmonella enterica]